MDTYYINIIYSIVYCLPELDIQNYLRMCSQVFFFFYKKQTNTADLEKVFNSKKLAVNEQDTFKENWQGCCRNNLWDVMWCVCGNKGRRSPREWKKARGKTGSSLHMFPWGWSPLKAHFQPLTDYRMQQLLEQSSLLSSSHFCLNGTLAAEGQQLL